MQAEASEDFATSVGAGAEETIYTTVGSSVRMRLPWLTLNLFLALIVAFVIERQTGIISAEPVLAALMPVVALLGGNGGIQSLAVVIRSMASGDLPHARIWEVLRRQIGIGLLNGAFLALAAMGLTIALISLGLFSSNFGAGQVAPVVGVAAFANMDHRHFGWCRYPHSAAQNGVRPGAGFQHLFDPYHRCSGIRRVSDGGRRITVSRLAKTPPRTTA